jgi:hypothetical protein
MSEINNTESVYAKAGKRKRSTHQQNDEIPFEPNRKVRKKFQIVHVKSSNRSSVTDCPLEGSAASSSSVEDCPPRRPTATSRSSVAGHPLHESAAGVQKVEISDSRGNELEPVDHADDEHGSVDEDEKVTGHSSMESSSDGDPVKCPVCSATFTTQEVGTPDTCDHTFCAACLQEWTKNKNNCPVGGQMFKFILVRHHRGGEIVTRIPVEPPRQQSDCDHEDREHVCDDKDLGWQLPLLCAVMFMLYVYRFTCALIEYISQ